MHKRDLTGRLLDALGTALSAALLLGGWLLSLNAVCGLSLDAAVLLGWCLLLSAAVSVLSCLPGKFRWGAAGCLAAAALLSLWRWEALLPGLRELLARTAAPLSAVFPALTLSPPQALPPESLVPAFLWLAAVMALVLGLFSALRCWWGAMGLCLLPLLPSVLAGELPSWPGFLAILAGGLPLLLTALFAPEARRSLGWSRLLSLALSGLLLLTLTAALPQDAYTYPQWATDGREWLLEHLNQGLDIPVDWQSPVDLPSDGGGLSYVVYQGEQVDLSAAGPRHFTGQTVLRVEGSEAGRVYLRGSSSSRYTGASWEPLDETDYADLSQALMDAGLSQDGTIPALLSPAAYLDGEGESASLTVSHVALSGSLAFAPYQPAEDAGLSLALTRDTCFTRTPQQSEYTLSYYPDFLPDTTASGSEVEQLYRNFVYQNYLSVPEETVRTLVPLSAQLPEMDVQPPEELAEDYRYAVTTALQAAQLLGEIAEYDLDTPAMAEGEDFVAHFLEEGRGYCVHFATTAALLLRINGIPARYVSGYTAAVTPGAVTDVPDSAAHAWVEIYLDGYGWYPVEVTPGGGETGQAADDPLPSDEPLPPDESLPDDQPQSDPPAVPVQPWEDSPVSDESAGDDAADSEPAAEPLDLRWLIAPMLVLLLAGLAWGLERLAVRRRRQEEGRPDTNSSALAAYRRCRLLVALGAAEDAALEDLARKAKFSQHTLSEEERRLCWQRLRRMAAEDAPRLPWWKRWLVWLLERY